MYTPINGWTKERIIKQIQTKMLDHRATGSSETLHSFGICKYKAADGNRCAVGIFIPKDHEAEEIEESVEGLLELYPDLTPLMPLELDALSALQAVHDEAYNHFADKGDPRPALIKWVEDNVGA